MRKRRRRTGGPFGNRRVDGGLRAADKDTGVRVWWEAARPKTLWASAAPVVMGTAMALADGALHAPSALCALVGALLIQVGTNYANDYSDFVKGADTEARIGPVRATQSGLVSPRTMKRATALVFLL